MIFKRITIIGLGLIGGSLGLAIKKRGISEEVIGVSRRRSTLLRAVSIGACDRVTLDIGDAVKYSDIVVLCVPVGKIIDIGREIAGLVKKGAVVTDAGSTKSEIIRSLEPAFNSGGNFVGSHPLAGSEKSGILNAREDLFENAYCIVTNTKRSKAGSVNKVKRLWRALGMKVGVMSPSEHDRIISSVSHIPHLVSVALTNANLNSDMKFAAGGFRDTTRIAAGNPELWKDIFLTNKTNILKDLRRLKLEIERLEVAIKRGDEKRIFALLEKAREFRKEIG